MPKLPTDYSKTIIYKIVCKDFNIKDCYVGSTTEYSKRKYSHKQRCNNPSNKKYHYAVYEFIRNNGGWDNWEMILVETFPCNSKLDALKRERHWFEELKANLNTVKNIGLHLEFGQQQYNKLYKNQNKDKIQEQEKIYKVKYYNNNKEQLLAVNKLYRDKNQEAIDKAHKKYYEQHKEEIHQRVTKSFHCNCGSTIQYGEKSRHLKSKKHLDYIASNQ